MKNQVLHIYFQMGQIEILNKINKEIKKEFTEESQVVYILSRIRKYLELKNLKDKYKHLNFYCNWALHIKIDRTSAVKDILKNFINNNDNGKFLSFEYLYSDLKRFLDDHYLDSSNLFRSDNYLNFINLLVSIYSDTPIEIISEVKKIIINKPLVNIKDAVCGVEYRIESMDKINVE